MPTIGWFEILIIVAIAIIVLGPKDFPIMLKKVGSWIGTAKKYINNIQTEVSNIDLEENKVAKKENKSGYILSLVGNLSNATLQCPGKEKVTIIKSHLEIISLNGTISPSKCHLHLSVSDGECNIFIRIFPNSPKAPPTKKTF